MSAASNSAWHEPTCAVRMHRNQWPIEAIHDAILLPCKRIRHELNRAEHESIGYPRDHIVRSRL